MSEPPVVPPIKPDGALTPTPEATAAASTGAESASRPREFGGPGGPEPTRYGDWERAGRCIDF